MKSTIFLSYRKIVSLVGELPISGFSLCTNDLLWLKFKRIYHLEEIIDNNFISKN